VSPADYGKAVFGYSRLTTGAGQNHRALGGFLTADESDGPKIVPVKYGDGFQDKDYVTLYRLTLPGQHGQIQEQDSSDERSRDADLEKRCRQFSDPESFYSYEQPATDDRCSRIIFLRGFMSAAWLNNIGARYFVDPEYFCRHLDFRPADDNSNNFSIPALPSSSWHLIELPIMTIGTFKARDSVEQMRAKGIAAVGRHHQAISKLALSGMSVGESMIRDFYVFDEAHFAIEQRISICMQEAGDKFSCKVPNRNSTSLLTDSQYSCGSTVEETSTKTLRSPGLSMVPKAVFCRPLDTSIWWP